MHATHVPFVKLQVMDNSVWNGEVLRTRELENESIVFSFYWIQYNMPFMVLIESSTEKWSEVWEAGSAHSMLCTFVASAIVGSEDNEVSSVCHGSSCQIVFLHLQPVSLPRFIYTLYTNIQYRTRAHNILLINAPYSFATKTSTKIFLNALWLSQCVWQTKRSKKSSSDFMYKFAKVAKVLLLWSHTVHRQEKMRTKSYYNSAP